MEEVSQYRKPIKKDEDKGIGKDLGTIGTIVGAIGGTLAGGQTLQGAQIGGQVGKIAGGVAQKAPDQKAQGTGANVETGQKGSITRRLETMDEENKKKLLATV